MVFGYFYNFALQDYYLSGYTNLIMNKLLLTAAAALIVANYTAAQTFEHYQSTDTDRWTAGGTIKASKDATGPVAVKAITRRP